VIDETDETGKRLVEVQVDGPLTTAEVTMFALSLLELTRAEGERWARIGARRKR
jgi:hypothetical protein